jgi:DNA-binding GntR family transcriptional regulator
VREAGPLRSGPDPADDDMGGAAKGGTLSDALRRKLEELIVSGVLAPGQRLDEVELATRFKVSRTPVREALKALAATGLLEIKTRGGATVATISIPMLLEMFAMMGALEGLCAKYAARRATPAHVQALRDIHVRLTDAVASAEPDRFYAINGEFHDVLYEASQTQFLAVQTRALRRRVAPYRRFVTQQPGRMAATIGEHARILAAIERADPDAAFAAALDHVHLLGDEMADVIAAFALRSE